MPPQEVEDSWPQPWRPPAPVLPQEVKWGLHLWYKDAL